MTDAISAKPDTRMGDLPGLYATLTKMRLSVLVVITTFVGYLMASGDEILWLRLLFTVLGTMACALSANALNQVFETNRDRLMDRTKGRPTPSGAMSRQHAFIFAVILGYAGVFTLAMLVNIYAAGLALGTLLLYLLAYTPLKVISTFNTIVGAIVGAIPPMIGWVAVRDSLEIQAWILAGILFIWQLPHFLSLAWMYRDQYAGAGFRMLPGVPGGETITAEIVLLTTLLLIPLGLSVTLSGLAGIFFAVVATLLGLGFTWYSFKFLLKRDRRSARSTFLFSLLYLPVLLLAMSLNRQIIPSDGLVVVDMNPDAAIQPRSQDE
ncbi:MAG: heme o synthase [Phycisphaerales bacterium]|nr:heme o synthase [Phycisphaerales bacterium]